MAEYKARATLSQTKDQDQQRNKYMDLVLIDWQCGAKEMTPYGACTRRMISFQNSLHPTLSLHNDSLPTLSIIAPDSGIYRQPQPYSSNAIHNIISAFKAKKVDIKALQKEIADLQVKPSPPPSP